LDTKVPLFIHLVPKIRIRGAVPPLSILLHGVVLNKAEDVFMAWYLVKNRTDFTFTNRNCKIIVRHAKYYCEILTMSRDFV